MSIANSVMTHTVGIVPFAALKKQNQSVQEMLHILKSVNISHHCVCAFYKKKMLLSVL